MPHQPLLIHIGYHKTATTWLQRQLFVNSDAGFNRPVLSRPIIDTLIMPHDLDFNPTACQHAFQPAIDDVRAARLVPVISTERLSGHPYSGGYDSKSIADRLCTVFPDGKVLIVIREQNSVIYSAYTQYVKRGGGSTIRSYMLRKHLGAQPIFTFEFYQYHRLIQYYHQLYGRERVLVLPYELFVKDSKAYVDAIWAFCGLPHAERFWQNQPEQSLINASPSGLVMPLLRWVNYLFGPRTDFNEYSLFPVSERRQRSIITLLERINRLVPRAGHGMVTKRMKQQVALAVGDMYRESNRRTAELTGMDLAAYGYAI